MIPPSPVSFWIRSMARERNSRWSWLAGEATALSCTTSRIRHVIGELHPGFVGVGGFDEIEITHIGEPPIDQVRASGLACDCRALSSRLPSSALPAAKRA